MRRCGPQVSLQGLRRRSAAGKAGRGGFFASGIGGIDRLAMALNSGKRSDERARRQPVLPAP
ncbi:hypothetical protein EFP19_23260 [Burkholderia glumae]|nr:hypothetical protein EFP19_23260 [Burkholderia glumae]